MTKPKKAPSGDADDQAQSAAFLEKARELEADKDVATADRLMGALATMKPEPRAKKKAPEPVKTGPGHSKTADRSNH